MEGFEAVPLDAKTAAQAFPLIQALHPDIDRAAWRRFTGRITGGMAKRATRGGGAGGGVALRGENGYLCGLFVYQVVEDLRHGRTLAVDHLVALDLIGAAKAEVALLAAAEAQAALLGCDSLQVRTPQRRGAWASRMAAAGFAPEAAVLCKKLTPPGPSAAA